jgi:hypothetical protein
MGPTGQTCWSNASNRLKRLLPEQRKHRNAELASISRKACWFDPSRDHRYRCRSRGMSRTAQPTRAISVPVCRGGRQKTIVAHQGDRDPPRTQADSDTRLRRLRLSQEDLVSSQRQFRHRVAAFTAEH